MKNNVQSPAPPSLESVYVERSRFLSLTLQRLGVRTADLDDVCQEVLIVVQRKLPQFDPTQQLKPWLFAICAHTAANYRRLARVRLEVTSGRMSADDALNPATPPFAQPDRQLVVREQLLRVERALLRMSSLKRSVFVLFEVEGRSCREIADELRLPLGTVYSRLHSARQSFAAFWARERQQQREPAAVRNSAR